MATTDKLAPLSTLLKAPDSYSWPSPQILEAIETAYERHPELARTGSTIKLFRELLRISQSELSSAVGVSQAYLSLLESGDRLASEQRTQQIWTAFSRLASGHAEALAETLVRLEAGQLVVTQKMAIDEGESNERSNAE